MYTCCNSDPETVIRYLENVYFRSQILERSSIGKYWNISGVPVLPENLVLQNVFVP